MIKIENECVSCDLPCVGHACPYIAVKRYYCDKCMEESDKLYHFDGMQLCEDCVLSELEIVDMDDDWLF